MNLEASHIDEAGQDRADGVAAAAARAAAMKFTYPSGSRPLDGYTIKRGVGRGGFGEVYFATSDAGKEVALKLIRRNLEVELRGVRQCLNLKHPNLIGLYDIRTDEMGDQWVIMEYVSGESLEDVIDRHSNGMPIGEVLWWMRAMCAGVAHLHDHGIVHRDLKPGNIFLDEGTVKIGDYGLAKFISCSRRSGQTESVGTVHYMAPEIANGRYGREIDTYALGIILFEMLTGHVPFEGESVGEVLMKHLTAEPDLSRLAEPYRTIVGRALAKDPDARIKSVDEMLTLLPDEAAAGEAVFAAGGSAEVASAASKAPGPTAAWNKPRAAGAKAPAAPVIEEPIWKAIREGVFAVQQRWNGESFEQMHPLPKAVLIFAAVAICLYYTDTVLGLVVPALIVYVIYYKLWGWLVRPGMVERAASAGTDQPVADLTANTVDWRAEPMTPAARYAESVRRRRELRPSWRQRARQELAAKPWREKLAELLGSMLVAALVASIAALAAPLMLGGQSERWITYAWLAGVGTLGSWAVLIPAKYIEGKLDDQLPMRIILLLLGGLVGAGAWGLGDLLLLQTPGWHEPVEFDAGLISQNMLAWSMPTGNANASLEACIAYFAFLFLLLRWWRQADYTRRSRLSLGTVLACVFCAWLLHMFWWFPQPNGMLAAGVIAVSTQLASPWLSPSRRRAMQIDVQQA